MNIFIKEKEHALGIDMNPRARPVCPVGIGKYYKPNGNAENKANESAQNDTNEESYQ